MKLYYAPDTCSLSPHIVLRELNLSLNWLESTTEARSPLMVATSAPLTLKGMSRPLSSMMGRYSLRAGHRAVPRRS
jgi:hypothetical protein